MGRHATCAGFNTMQPSHQNSANKTALSARVALPRSAQKERHFSVRTEMRKSSHLAWYICVTCADMNGTYESCVNVCPCVWGCMEAHERGLCLLHYSAYGYLASLSLLLQSRSILFYVNSDMLSRAPRILWVCSPGLRMRSCFSQFGREFLAFVLDVRKRASL